ncbi:MAG: DNA methyltransferase, partial [Candidatus Hodarchaeota archaeon]
MQISSSKQLSAYLQNYTFRENLEKFFPISSKQTTIVETIRIENKEISRYTNEFWTSKQRQASSIHEISYRACFKPQLPRFFINLLTKPKDTVYDPFGGRGTTVIEAGLLKRNIISNDINPLSKILTYPRFFIPTYEEIKERFKSIPFEKNLHADIDLSMFYHPNTESEIVSLKEYLLNKSRLSSTNFLISLLYSFAIVS